jgi:hypothetical protein
MEKDDVLFKSEFGDEIRFSEERDGTVLGYYVAKGSEKQSQVMPVDQIIMLAGDGNVGWEYVAKADKPNTPTK